MYTKYYINLTERLCILKGHFKGHGTFLRTLKKVLWKVINKTDKLVCVSVLHKVLWKSLVPFSRKFWNKSRFRLDGVPNIPRIEFSPEIYVLRSPEHNNFFFLVRIVRYVNFEYIKYSKSQNSQIVYSALLPLHLTFIWSKNINEVQFYWNDFLLLSSIWMPNTFWLNYLIYGSDFEK